jgi:hypothetical protein
VRLHRISIAVGLVSILWAGFAPRGESAEVRVEDSVLDVRLPTSLPENLTEKQVLDWVKTSAEAVAAYCGRFPVPRVRVGIRVTDLRKPVSGVTHGGRVPSIRLSLGPGALGKDLQEDWVLTHEMFHLAFPDLTSDDSWAEEGLSTYAEPVARVRAGGMPEKRMWAEMMDGAPKGLPGPRDPGLHGTDEWGRTYWGGAVFWLLADIGIREATQNRRGLEQALRGILDAGGDIRARWTLLRTLRVGDEAVGGTVLSDLYAQLGAKRGEVDLAELWRRLGLQRRAGRLVYNEGAPLASVRRGIVEGAARQAQR